RSRHTLRRSRVAHPLVHRRRRRMAPSRQPFLRPDGGHPAGGLVKIITRDVPPRAAWALEQAGIHPLLARLYAARGVAAKEELDNGLGRLLAPASLKGAVEAARLLADAIAADRKLCIVADYDCDGATACAVGLRGLRMLGAKNVSYLVPD